ncbi:MAG TPA: endolytic transglycosylase MltG [Edaphobacter sp.]
MKFLGTLLLLVLIALAIAGYVVYAPFGPSNETFVDIPTGTGSKAIAAQLERNGIIRSRYGFDLLRLIKGGTLKAGEYRFDHPVPMPEVYARLVRGDVYTRSLTIPEGYNIFDIAQAVEAAGFGSRDAFLAAARQHTELIAEWTANGDTKPESLEGFLFPDTYHFSRHTTPEQILTAMVHRFRQVSTQLGLTGDIFRTVTMASLVEKEVSQSAERPLVAGVFVNRLAKGMPLATDPSVIYAALLENRWRGTIYASDLQSPSLYNTYKHTGLPPGPIANPGVASLKAAIAPTQTDYLYFVSDAAGHSRFSADLKEHAEQVQAYRQAQRAQQR